MTDRIGFEPPPPPAAAGGGGVQVLHAGDITDTPWTSDPLPVGSVVRITWSGDRGILGDHALNNGGVHTLWIIAGGTADFGGLPPTFCLWSCMGGVLSLWLNAANTTCRVVVEKVK